MENIYYKLLILLFYENMTISSLWNGSLDIVKDNVIVGVHGVVIAGPDEYPVVDFQVTMQNIYQTTYPLILRKSDHIKPWKRII